nr:MAG TPA: hypothetical protein [Bacteriophage sp.]
MQKKSPGIDTVMYQSGTLKISDCLGNKKSDIPSMVHQ